MTAQDGHPAPNATGLGATAGSGGLRNLTEAEFAELRAEEGARVVERDGRFWIETFRGFYQPVHQLAEHSLTTVHRPASGCWGYRAALVPEDRAGANGAYPVHLLEDFRSYSTDVLEENRRRDLRKCRHQVEIVVARDPEPFLAGGWAVYDSARERIPEGPPRLGREAYLRDIERRVQDPRRLIVAGFMDGRLAGYLESYAVDGVFYGRDLYVATHVVRSGIATGLYLDSISAGLASGVVDRLCLGPEMRERPGLAFFKKSMGIGVVQVPTKVVIPGPIRAFMRAVRPAAYYRITGSEPSANGETASASGS